MALHIKYAAAARGKDHKAPGNGCHSGNNNKSGYRSRAKEFTSWQCQATAACGTVGCEDGGGAGRATWSSGIRRYDVHPIILAQIKHNRWRCVCLGLRD